MAEPDDALPSDTIHPEPLSRALGGRYLQYALSTIMHRALPDARDGLKPVHRRILFAMRGLRLGAGGPFRKCAKIAGDVMGNYHPHGDQAIYDALARLAQPFAMRYPLVDGQGNFGNIDGDNPAAARYTEARLAAAAEALMAGLDEDAVDFRPNYDGTLEEPVVLPAAFPNLLANGASGIAVGMATAIPPHNLGELLAACQALIADPGMADAALLALVPGPDFPTGGELVEPPEAVAEAYRTGRGGFRLRARWRREDLGRGAWQIVVTEIPFQVAKARLIERLAELIEERKLPLLADVRDESAEDVRIVLEPRARSVDPGMLMAALFRACDLEVRVPLNMNVLIDGRVPRVCSLREVLGAFLGHRREVLGRRARHRLARIDQRLEILEGLIVAFLNLDRVIDIIRYDDDPGDALRREDWGRRRARAASERDYVAPAPRGPGHEDGLSEVQAEAILNLRLRALRRLEELALRREYDALLAERAGLEDLLAEPARQWAHIGEELAATARAFGTAAPGGARRTAIGAVAPPAVPAEALIEREPVTVVLSRMGWIRALRGHLPEGQDLRFKDGDGPRFHLHAVTTDRLVLAGSNGRFHTLQAAQLPGGRGPGEPVRLMVDLPNEAEVTALFVHRPEGRLLLASSTGDGFLVPSGEVLAQTRAGKAVMNLAAGARLAVVRRVAGDHVAVVGENRKLLVFPLAELPEMARGKGVRLQRYRDGGLADATTLALARGLAWKDPAGRTRSEPDLGEWLAPRGSAGRMAPRGFPRDNRFG
ncbi:MAG: DNA topoisomerase IV subunit A [Rhodobacteraceae bacterium]|nr:DNA topoisomerase IV subunit A [Paracoccaceae bacterium]